ncbi:hypothetical protein D5366_00045 [Neokomagataea tanensis]|uniref:Glycosyltransferase RgtA/B/C/D-like domain-containing protein n=1 Tax=Neokomagataea tanensis TaxID=661191 RepID=A0A4Y6V4W4_9PROT|nr:MULTISPECIES: hypothetical protein [Neokomagataea]QDH23928.1 hypothetical protein D5366_00045 [Neokomagataea tanensis]
MPRKKDIVFIGLGFFLSLFYLAIAFHVASLWPKTSDQAGYFEAGLAVLHGNWRLHGWMLTAPDFWTSDIVVTALLGGIWRLLGHPANSPALMMLQPALLWTGLVASAFFLTFQRLKTAKSRIGAGIFLLATLGVPLFRSPMAYFITLSAIHIGTLIYSLWALHWADRALSGNKRCIFLCSSTILIGTIGDPLLEYTATLAILCAVIFSQNRFNLNKILLALSVISATIVAKLLLTLNAATGGFTTEAAENRFASWSDLGTNLSTTTRDFLLVFGADPSGRLIGQSIPELLRFSLVIFSVSAIIFVARNWWRKRCVDFASLLVFTTLLNICALAVSTRIALDGNSIASARYLFPTWVCCACLIALCWANNRGAVFLAFLALSATIIADKRDIPHHSTGILTADDSVLLEYLEQKAPSIGIGSWWGSVNFTAASLDRLHVIPGMHDAQGFIHPFYHIQQRFDWSEFNGKSFFVLLPHPEETFTKADILHSFGPPAETHTIGKYDVFIYANTHPAIETH